MHTGHRPANTSRHHRHASGGQSDGTCVARRVHSVDVKGMDMGSMGGTCQVDLAEIDAVQRGHATSACAGASSVLDELRDRSFGEGQRERPCALTGTVLDRAHLEVAELAKARVACCRCEVVMSAALAPGCLYLTLASNRGSDTQAH